MSARDEAARKAAHATVEPVTIPAEPLPVPAVVAGIAAGRAVRAVWRNELGGVTFSIGDGSEARH